MIPLCGYTQFDLNYDFITNTLSVEYNPCDDPCAFRQQDNPDAEMSACHCNRNCISTFDREDCIQACRDGFTGLTQFSICIENCADEVILSADREEACLESCPELDGPAWEIGRYEFSYVADHAAIGQDPRDGITNRVIEFGGFGNDDIEIPDWNPPAPWPDIANERNTCYGISSRIYYVPTGNVPTATPFVVKEGTIWICNIIG